MEKVKINWGGSCYCDDGPPCDWVEYELTEEGVLLFNFMDDGFFCPRTEPWQFPPYLKAVNTDAEGEAITIFVEPGYEEVEIFYLLKQWFNTLSLVDDFPITYTSVGSCDRRIVLGFDEGNTVIALFNEPLAEHQS